MEGRGDGGPRGLAQLDDSSEEYSVESSAMYVCMSVSVCGVFVNSLGENLIKEGGREKYSYDEENIMMISDKADRKTDI